MSIALVAQAKAASFVGQVTTSAPIDSTGANLLIAISNDYVGPGTGLPPYTISDSKGNTWHALTQYQDPTVIVQVAIWWCTPTSVGTGHTLTIQGFGSCIHFSAWSDADVISPPDGQTGAGGNGITNLQPGTLTASQNGDLFIVGVTSQSTTSSFSTNSGFTTLDHTDFNSGVNEGGYWAYLVQGSAAALNPTVNLGAGSSQVVMTLAAFKAGSGNTTVNQDIDAVANIVIAENKTITAKADIRVVTPKTIPALARINQITPQTIPAKARISGTNTQTIPAKANLLGTVGRPVNAKGNIVGPIGSCEDFESYPLGYTGPYGSTFTSGGAYVASGGPNGSAQFLIISNGALTYAPGFPVQQATVVFGYNFFAGHDWTILQSVIFRDTNGTSAHDFITVKPNADGTISVFANGIAVSTSAQAFQLNRWYWIQINVKLVAVLGEVFADVSSFIDGDTLCPTGLFDTGLTTSQLFGFGFNNILFSALAGGLDNICIKPYTTSAIYPNPGTPNTRVAQAFTDLVVLPSNSPARVAQGYVDLVTKPTNAKIKIGQGFIELVCIPDVPPPQPTPPVPTPFLGRPKCTVQLRITPFVPDDNDQPKPPVPTTPNKFCVPQVVG